MAYRSSSSPSFAPTVVGLVLVGIFAAAVGLAQVVDLPTLPSLRDGVRATGDKALRRSPPTLISVPSLGVRAQVVEVGEAEDGRIATPQENPAETTGWYALGPSPGEPGTSVIVGHVDTRDHPAVFHNLPEIRPGKFIEIKRRDGKIVTFRVDSVETFPKDKFPADRIFAKSDTPRLALVTCGGRWVGGDAGYADNVIVFATRA